MKMYVKSINWLENVLQKTNQQSILSKLVNVRLHQFYKNDRNDIKNAIITILYKTPDPLK